MSSFVHGPSPQQSGTSKNVNGKCGQTVSKLRALCDGRPFSSVVAGKASVKADTQHIATGSGVITDEVERGHIASTICSDSVEKHTNECHKVVDGADNTDQKMKIFDINGLEDKYLNAIINRSYHSNITPKCDSQSHENWKAQSDFNFGFTPMGEF